jgi:hypothetical protein
MQSITLVEGALDELSAELLIKNTLPHLNVIEVEVWENKEGKTRTENVSKYYSRRLIPVGYTEYDSANNREFSYVFALPVPPEDYTGLISADDYIGENDKHLNIKLSLDLFTEEELKDKHYNVQDIEVCDAITRLWDDKNIQTLEKLHSIIDREDFSFSKDEVKVLETFTDSMKNAVSFAKLHNSFDKAYHDMMFTTADEMKEIMK